MKKLFAILVTLVIIASLCGCNKKEAESGEPEVATIDAVVEYANGVAEAFTKGDLSAINETIFGTSGLEMDDDLSAILGESSEQEEGILNSIFENTTVKVLKTTNETIEFEIESPDMSSVFDDLKTVSREITADDLRNYIEDYTTQADKKTTAVSLNYIIVDGEPVVNYREESFINAVTGGLLEAYKSLYREMMEEYIGGAN